LGGNHCAHSLSLCVVCLILSPFLKSYRPTEHAVQRRSTRAYGPTPAAERRLNPSNGLATPTQPAAAAGLLRLQLSRVPSGKPRIHTTRSADRFPPRPVLIPPATSRNGARTSSTNGAAHTTQTHGLLRHTAICSVAARLRAALRHPCVIVDNKCRAFDFCH